MYTLCLYRIHDSWKYGWGLDLAVGPEIAIDTIL